MSHERIIEPKNRAPRDSMSLSRRRFVKIALGLGAVGSVLVLNGDKITQFVFGPGGQQNESPKDELDVIARRLVSGGPPKDGIPAIRNPQYITREEADKMLNDDNGVFGLDLNGDVKAIPRNILNWHEIMNDIIGGRKVAVTYCPLTGSAIGYRGRSKGSGEDLSFGVSGMLYNSNLVMYDHQTDSFWPQILGIAINGPNKGTVLEEIPVYTTTWERWKTKHPDTLVLSRNTGHIRNYSVNPYEGYDNSAAVYFPITASDNRFHPKKVLVGLKLNGQQWAIPKDEAKALRVANATFAGQPLVVFYDSELDILRVYSRKVGEKTLEFAADRERFRDNQTSSEWTAEGLAVNGSLKGSRLTLLNSYEVMWFAWHAFYPNTAVFKA